jgi:hypothetical protein
MRHPADQSLELRGNRRSARLALPTPVKLEALAVPMDEGSRRQTVRAPRQSKQRLSHSRVKRVDREVRPGLIARSW